MSYPLSWSHLFIPNRTIRAHLQRWAPSRTSWLSLAKSCVSIENIALNVRYVLTDYNLGIHEETGQWIGRNYHTAFDAHPAKMSDPRLEGSPRTPRLCSHVLLFSPYKSFHVCVIQYVRISLNICAIFGMFVCLISCFFVSLYVMQAVLCHSYDKTVCVLGLENPNSTNKVRTFCLVSQLQWPIWGLRHGFTVEVKRVGG